MQPLSLKPGHVLLYLEYAQLIACQTYSTIDYPLSFSKNECPVASSCISLEMKSVVELTILPH
ncbi:hypothetical protein PAHAL_4G015100 [Panicum hallii]|uniref:Uncharacterized protein n=1 Tax=Panicum hallii TaxID=206008 RepID=A0A2S3HGC2_9POAL|nr:hypothetical protein PAHAL_4G015100 [Panicum hallii]